MPTHTSHDQPVDLIAIDLDGTLLGADESVSRANVDAVERARAAGITVLVCTGRGLGESVRAMRSINQRSPVMVAGGSIIADPVSGKTIHRFTMGPDVVGQAIDMFHAVRCPVLVMKDPSEIGYDYLVVNSDDEHPIHPITEWWIEDHQLRVQYAKRLEHDEHQDHTVRVGIVAPSSISNPLSTQLVETLGDRAWLYDFPCVVPPDHVGEQMHILELFAVKINKWTAISWYLDQHRIEPARVAAIGDQVNDVPMIEGAGFGIAMGNAVEQVKGHASYTTSTNAEDGVARAIHALLDGQLEFLTSKPGV